jgi:hypothetical protein
MNTTPTSRTMHCLTDSYKRAHKRNFPKNKPERNRKQL